MSIPRCLALGLVVLAASCLYADDPPRRSPREASPRAALYALRDLIGAWRGTAVPAGNRDAQQKGFWVETLNWQWQFKGQDAWFKVTFDKSKNFTHGELRYRPERNDFALTLATKSKETLTFAGPFRDKVLTLERHDKDRTQRLVFTLLHDNRFLYRSEIRPAGKALFTRQYNVGATREGVPFAAESAKPECVVSGGLGTLTVTFMVKTYYVCCGGCRDEFQANPEKYVKEHEAKKKAKK